MKPASKRRTVRPVFGVALCSILCLVVAGSCQQQPTSSSAAIRLIDQFGTAMVTDQPDEVEPIPPTEWREAEALGEWKAGPDSRLRVSEDTLVLRARKEVPLAYFSREPEEGLKDVLHAVEVRMRTSKGSDLGIFISGNEDLDLDQRVENTKTRGKNSWPLNTPIIADGEMHTYTVGETAARRLSIDLSAWRHIAIGLVDAAEAEAEIEWIRLISRREHLQNVPSGIGFHGFANIFRESLVSRAPEKLRFDLELPARPWLDLNVGTLEPMPLTFRVTIEDGNSQEQVALTRTITTPLRWEETQVDLSEFAGRTVSMTLALEGDPGSLGVWGSPVIRSSGATPHVDSADVEPPRGVILIVADTLRRDHLDAYGYDRPTAPVIAQLASDGVLFTDNQSQGTWTKISVPSILTSLYPTTHGLVSAPDRLPAAVDTAAEIFRSAGYATWASSSVPFTGQLSNLHQGVEVLHERNSIPESGSKTARTFVDRLAHWIEGRRQTPFFAVLHVFDPHSPFEPRAPYDNLWASSERKVDFLETLEKVKPEIENPSSRRRGLPRTEELEAAGVEIEPFVQFEKDWYDGSIRGLDAEVARLLEKLEQLGLREKTLIAFIADHGEEFLEHGSHWHGNNVYGEMTNVPMILYGPDRIPPGQVIDQTVRSIDLLPTLLTLSGLTPPETLQGRSLAAFLTGKEQTLEPLPAFSERMRPDGPETHETSDSYAVVMEGWKLIHNVRQAEGVPEFELFDHTADPLNLRNVAPDHPEIVTRLSETLDAWKEMATAAKLEEDMDTEGLSQAELERLRSLGYIR